MYFNPGEKFLNVLYYYHKLKFSTHIKYSIFCCNNVLLGTKSGTCSHFEYIFYQILKVGHHSFTKKQCINLSVGIKKSILEITCLKLKKE